MSKSTSRILGVLFVLIGSAECRAQLKPDMIERGKKATALVEVTGDAGVTIGSGFCIDKSGLFITNAHVVEKAAGKKGVARVVVDIGLETQRILRAKVLRHDDAVNLALVQVDATASLTPLELGRDADLKELAEVFAFGYPFGQMLAVGRGTYPDVTVLPSRITSLRKDKGRLEGIQLDNPISPGHSGGPLLDGSGRVVGVAVATAPGAAPKLMIPVGHLADFLATPGLVFEPPPLTYEDRAKPVTWTIRVQPPTPVAKLPEKLSVAVTVSNKGGEPRTYKAQPAGTGTFKVTLAPVPRDPERKVGLTAWDGSTFLYEVLVKDDDVRVGDKKFRLSDLRFLYGGSSPRVQTSKGDTVSGPIRGLGKVKAKVLQRSAKVDRTQAPKLPFFGGLTVAKYETKTVDLNRAPKITVTQLQPPGPVQEVEALVEAKQGSKVLAMLRQRTKLTVATASVARPTPPPASGGFRIPGDDGLLKLGGALNVDGAPRGAGKAIQPPRITIPAARLTPGTEQRSEAPLVRRLDGRISDVAVGGAGRFLLLTLKDNRKLAVFDVNAADVVKTIPLPSANALVAAGATKVLIVFPEEKLLQRWDLATLQREGGTRPSPIKQQISRLVLGSDSNGPALACWQTEEAPGVVIQSIIHYGFSFLDLDSLTVLKVGLTASTGSVAVSASGGSFTSNWTLGKAVRIRASAGGALFGIWDPGYQEYGILSVHGNALGAAKLQGDLGHLVPGPDGRTVFTGSGGRLDVDGKPIGQAEPPGLPAAREMAVPSSDPVYYLSIAGLSVAVPGFPRPSSTPGAETVSVHAADGSRLLTVHGLDEMAGTVMNEIWVPGIPDDLTTDKRFHLVPAAHLLITIPPTNDRLVLRRLELDAAHDRAGGDRLTVVSLPTLTATAGQKLEHQIVARSKEGGITYTLARGPDGLELTPDGKLTWIVPQTRKGQDVTAVVTVGDASGAELFHTLKIRVE
jgi:hypothetical protein